MAKHSVDRLTSQNLFAVTSLDSMVQGYILNCRCEGRSPTTVDTYEQHLKRFLWYCEEQGIPDEPQRLTAHHVRAFLWYVSSEPVRWNGSSTTACKPVKQSTVNHYYRVLNTFFVWLKGEGLISENPLANVKHPKMEQSVKRALTQPEITALLNCCPQKTKLGCRNRAMLLMFLDTGMRVSELASLEIGDIDMKTGVIFIRHGKGGKQRAVRIGSVAQKALWRYLTMHRKGNTGRVFLNKSGGPLNENAIKLMVRRLGETAGVSGVHVHRLRHTFAIMFLRAGGDIFTLKYLLGHSSLTMVENYLRSLSADDAINAHKRFSPLDNMTK